MRPHPHLRLAVLAALLLAPVTSSAESANTDSVPVATKIEVLRGKDGARLIFKLPKTCRLVDDDAAAQAKKGYAAAPDLEYLAGYWCYTEVDGEALAGVAVITYQSSPPPPASEFNRACTMALRARLDWVKSHFGDFGKLKVTDARCDAANERITLIGSQPTPPLDSARMALVPGSKGAALVNVIFGEMTPPSLRIALEALPASLSIRQPQSAPPASATRP